MLERLPEKLPNILHPETASTVQKLWIDLKKLYSYLTSTHPDTIQLEEYFQDVKKWIHLSPTLSSFIRTIKCHSIHAYYGLPHTRIYREVQEFEDV